MEWLQLNDEAQLKEIIEESKKEPVLIFKHSTRCSISAMVKSRLESTWKAQETDVKPYYLDLLSYRPISQKIQELFHVIHESPQALLISNGTCVYHASHIAINFPDIKNQATVKS